VEAQSHPTLCKRLVLVQQPGSDVCSESNRNKSGLNRIQIALPEMVDAPAEMTMEHLILTS